MRSVPVSVHLALSGLSPTSTGTFLNDDDDEGARLAKALVDNGSADLKRLLQLQNLVRDSQSLGRGVDVDARARYAGMA